MLTGLKFKNYKAFDTGDLEIKPVTILLGANSVGKSSIIQLFLMLQETALAENYKSAIKLYGGFFSLGEGSNLFRKKDTNNPLHFQCRFSEPAISEIIKKDYLSRFFEEVVNYCFFILSRMSNDENTAFLDEHFVSKNHPRQLREMGYLLSSRADSRAIMNRDVFVELVKRTHETLAKTKNKELLKEMTASVFLFRNSFVGESLLNNKDEVVSTYDFIKKLYDLSDAEKVVLDYDFKYAEGALRIKKFVLTIGNTEIIQIDFDKPNDSRDFLKSTFINLARINNRHWNGLSKVFKNTKTVFSFIDPYEASEGNYSVLCHYLSSFISEVIDKVEESFNTQRINYVSPLRAYPKRYYFLDKAKVNAFLDTLDGEAIAEILKENSTLKSSVNSWFKKFNLHIDVGPIRDIIHQIVVKQNSLDLDITDVGFGVSQVLPVIIQGFLSKEKSITLIEQPEIHLHPKMQADLADLFIDIALRKTKKENVPSKYLIIETHSEYLLKRLRRRISEGKINAAHVGIFYIEPQGESAGATIKQIDISEKGAFDWPKDFYTGELADDIIEFLNNQTL